MKGEKMKGFQRSPSEGLLSTPKHSLFPTRFADTPLASRIAHTAHASKSFCMQHLPSEQMISRRFSSSIETFTPVLTWADTPIRRFCDTVRGNSLLAISSSASCPSFHP